MVPRSFRPWLLLGSFFLLEILFLVGGASSVQAAAGINEQINYQGKLMDSSGTTVPDGSYQLGFSIYDAATAGTRLWSASGTVSVPTKIPVTVNNGLFTVLLGDTSASGGWQNAFATTTDWNSTSLYIGVTVGADAEMTPRKRIGAVPQAFNAAQLQGMSASGTGMTRESLFKIHRTDTAAILGPRSALDVMTDGTDGSNDYIARFQNSSGVDRFSIRNDGFVEARNMTAGNTNTAAATFIAYNSGVTTNSWGAHIDKLIVGEGFGAGFISGADRFGQLIRYSATSKMALCLDDIDIVGTCNFTSGVSLKAQGAINASAFNVGAFDLAEMYTFSGDVEPGDLLSIDPENPMVVKRSSGVAYDPTVIGIVSTKPGFVLGEIASGTKVALAGRVPTKVSMENGTIAIGDALTSSVLPGVAMKATGPGQIIGYALQPATTTGLIEVFVKVGYSAAAFLQNEGGSGLVQGPLVMNATTTATASTPLSNSWGVTWRGSVWDGLQALKKDFTLLTQSALGGGSTFRLQMGTSTLWSVDEAGTMRTKGDLFLGGRFFPATRTGEQADKYIFLDDTGPASSTYIATNADGWQANTSYDFAERYSSSEALEPGDVVVLSQEGQFQVQRSTKSDEVPVGIVSTRPAFVAGAPATGTFPIALAGRVPTRVSASAGAIQIGDPLAPSGEAGVAVKASHAGPIVGYALEAFTATAVGKIEVYVSAGWWGGARSNNATVTDPNQAPILTSIVVTTTTTNLPKSYQGVARILAGSTKVKVVHPSLGTFPLIQVTPYGKVDTQWWTDHSSDRGFEILLKEPVTEDVTFSWRAEEMLPTDDQLFLSNDQTMQWDIHTGQPIVPVQPTAPQVQTETLPEVTSTTTEGVAVTTEPEVTLPTTPEEAPVATEPVAPPSESIVPPAETPPPSVEPTI